MFQNLYVKAQNNYRPISPIRTRSPFKNNTTIMTNRTPTKNQTLNVQRSPIRNRPSDIKQLKSFLNSFIPNKAVSPMKSRSPLKIDTNRETTFRNLTPRKTLYKQEVRYISPIRQNVGTNYQYFDNNRNGGEFWKIPSQICGNQPYSQLQPKQNSKLFTKLIKNIRSQGDDQNYPSQYNQRKTQVQRNNQLKRQTSLYQHYNQKLSTQIHFQTQTKQNNPQYYTQLSSKQVIPFNDKIQSRQSFGVIPFIQSITPSKFVQKPMNITLNPSSIIDSFGIPEQKVQIQALNSSVRQSISMNDRVIQSFEADDILELNMSLTK